MDPSRILDGLNAEQRAAAEATRGPVCILAGAGTGKTTTITRRIAWQVASGAFQPSQVVAVTFTDKAAGELRGRLAALGVEGVRASTFHSAALALLRRFERDPGRILATKALLLRRIGNTLPRPYRFRPAGDLATEVEWAKNRRLTPETYLEGLGDHEPPLPPDLAHRVFREYERRKAEDGALDFEDLLERAIRLLEEDDEALAIVREKWRAFTVDEYQDVNLLQQTLLEFWLGTRDDVCVVGDDYQSIYGFTGASAEWLLALPSRFPHARVVRLEQNYRSTPQVLELANRLVPRLGGSEKTLRALLPDGPEPEVRPNADVVARIAALAAEGVPLEEQAVLVRTNARTTEFEEAFHEAGIPFQGASLLDRDAARQLLKVLRGETSTAVAEVVRRTAVAQGLLDDPPEKLGEREQTRQADLARLVRLAEQFDDGERTVGELVESLHERFGATAGRGVHLLTLHRAKGLEFEAVVLPRLEEGELPIRRARGAEIEEERRLLYVGMTRAKRHLLLTWSGRPSRYLDELGVRAPARAATVPPGAPAKPKLEPTPAVQALREWRLARARAEDVPAYVVFNDRTLAELLRLQPQTIAELAAVPGIGPAKLERYGPDLLAALRDVA
ncbi:MAG TPA: ATP-dependent DNA helicase UvrD2 [Gaiellaceae bacterium]|nr:ATP-dependent DNA helicase UvrD2 [Gaiellaceae bacterium]